MPPLPSAAPPPGAEGRGPHAGPQTPALLKTRKNCTCNNNSNGALCIHFISFCMLPKNDRQQIITTIQHRKDHHHAVGEITICKHTGTPLLFHVRIHLHKPSLTHPSMHPQSCAVLVCADVGVVDVAVDHIRDRVAVDRSPQLIRCVTHCIKVCTPCLEEQHHVSLGQHIFLLQH